MYHRIRAAILTQGQVDQKETCEPKSVSGNSTFDKRPTYLLKGNPRPKIPAESVRTTDVFVELIAAKYWPCKPSPARETKSDPIGPWEYVPVLESPYINVASRWAGRKLVGGYNGTLLDGHVSSHDVDKTQRSEDPVSSASECQRVMSAIGGRSSYPTRRVYASRQLVSGHYTFYREHNQRSVGNDMK